MTHAASSGLPQIHLGDTRFADVHKIKQVSRRHFRDAGQHLAGGHRGRFRLRPDGGLNARVLDHPRCHGFRTAIPGPTRGVDWLLR